MSGHRHYPSLSSVRMGIPERLGIALAVSALLWGGIVWAIG